MKKRKKSYMIGFSKGSYFHRKEVTTRNNKDVWFLFKQFINIKKENQQFTRQEIYKFIYQDNDVCSELLKSANTVDSYLTYLKGCNFLVPVSRGIYIKPHSIKLPNELTIKMMQEITYGDQWKSWFIPLEDHIKLLVEGKKDANISGQK